MHKYGWRTEASCWLGSCWKPARLGQGVGTLWFGHPYTPGKDEKILPSLWPLGWSMGASGQTLPQAQKCTWGCKTLMGGRGTGHSCLNYDWKQMTFALCIGAASPISGSQFPSLGRNEGADQDAASNLPLALGCAASREQLPLKAPVPTNSSLWVPTDGVSLCIGHM